MTWLALPLLGAVLTLIGTVIVQTWVVPRTARRQRSDDRREADTRRLGELMSFEFAQAAKDFGYSVWWLHFLLWAQSTGSEVDPERFRKAEQEANERQQQLGVVESRADWLKWAITHGQPKSKIHDFVMAYEGLHRLTQRMHGANFVKITDVVTETQLDEVDALRNKYREGLNDVVKQIKRLEEEAVSRTYVLPWTRG